VTVWGIVALCSWGAAVFLANVSGLVPAHLLAGLHASRLEGATINQLRVQVAEIEAESNRMRLENNLLLQRFDLQQQQAADTTRRLGALEVSLPTIVERLPEAASIDNSMTASITDGTPVTYEADGGSVTVEQKPLIAIHAGSAAEGIAEQSSGLPDGSHFGVELGFAIEPADGEVQWQGFMAKVGTLLIGLEPVLAATEEGAAVIVAGPLATRSQAAELCGRLDRVGIPCRPAPFKGEPLPLLN
jgi:hypothetical protein